MRFRAFLQDNCARVYASVIVPDQPSLEQDEIVLPEQKNVRANTGAIQSKRDNPLTGRWFEDS